MRGSDACPMHGRPAKHPRSRLVRLIDLTGWILLVLVVTGLGYFGCVVVPRSF
jgi:hypothetical protein